MPSIIALTCSDLDDKVKMKYYIDSCKRNNVEYDIIGINKKFTWLGRMKWIKEYLETSNHDIVCFTDAYDVFYLDNLNTIKDKFLSFECDIVWSAEKMYSFQLNEDKSFFDNLYSSGNEYKYINAGTFMGYRYALLKLFTDIIDISLKDNTFINELYSINFFVDTIRGADQTWISHHLAKYWQNYNIKLDIECHIFYVPCDDWHYIEGCVDKDMKNIKTGKTPSVIHVCNKSVYEHILQELYSWKYPDSFLKHVANKEYTWGDYNTVRFLDHGVMNAFGKGWYLYIDDHTIKACFGGNRIHMITFNEDYSEYVSVREGDNDMVKGTIVI